MGRGDEWAAKETDAGNASAQFRYNNVPLDAYEYTRAAMSKGGFAFNPVYELKVRMDSLCADAKAGTPEADARLKSGFADLYSDLSKTAALWEQRDLRVVYHGVSLKQDLADAYAAEAHACVIDNSGDDKRVAATSLDQFARLSPETDVPGLIAQIDDSPRYIQMQPLGN